MAQTQAQPISINVTVTNQDSPSSTRRHDDVEAPLALKNGPGDVSDANRAYMHSYLRERHFKTPDEIRKIEEGIEALSQGMHADDIEMIYSVGPSAEAALEPLSNGQRIAAI